MFCHDHDSRGEFPPRVDLSARTPRTGPLTPPHREGPASTPRREDTLGRPLIGVPTCLRPERGSPSEKKFLGHARSPDTSVYSATKAFVAAPGETLWWEFQDRNIYVLRCNPDVTASNFHQVASNSGPPFLEGITQSPDQVARELFAALQERRSTSVISGGRNRMLLVIQRMLSRKSIMQMMSRFTPIKG